MREILFRGKRINNGEWEYGTPLIYEGRAWLATGVFGKSFDTGFPVFMEVTPETVGQYTGLTDKNGKKIFEGDIVKFNHDFYTCKVVYENGTFGLESNETLEPYSYEDYGMCDNFISLWEIYWNWDNTEQMLSDVEVIGNIHDNPELLEDK